MVTDNSAQLGRLGVLRYLTIFSLAQNQLCLECTSPFCYQIIYYFWAFAILLKIILVRLIRFF